MFPLPKHIGHQVRVLYWCTEQLMNEALSQMDLTASQGHIMGFLCRHSQPPCARDIEQFFRLSHPTVSGLLNRLEKKGFIEFFPDERDRRCKRIRVLPKGEQCHQRIVDTIHTIESRVTADFSDEDRREFSGYLERAMENLGIHPCQNHPKEEPQT